MNLPGQTGNGYDPVLIDPTSHMATKFAKIQTQIDRRSGHTSHIVCDLSQPVILVDAFALACKRSFDPDKFHSKEDDKGGTRNASLASYHKPKSSTLKCRDHVTTLTAGKMSLCYM